MVEQVELKVVHLPRLLENLQEEHLTQGRHYNVIHNIYNFNISGARRKTGRQKFYIDDKLANYDRSAEL